MSRRHTIAKREILPDPRCQSERLAKFINHVMCHGKKAVAENIVYHALATAYTKIHPHVINNSKKTVANKSLFQELAKEYPKFKIECMELFNTVLENVSPRVEVKSRRVGGATYQVPMEVRPSRRHALAMRWLIDSACKRGEKSMAARLGYELFDAHNGKGGAIKKREDVHKMADANKAFAHYRF